ncbi:MAG: hypothetical protein HC921_01210 [Synechococcaceae cyanobacterium SM2_3_1]|nr:hypothetical protein [Synechococcaceae cyanobacterium SM2_3_1]
MKAFFANGEYLQIWQKHYEPAVGNTTIHATYDQTSNPEETLSEDGVDP